MSTDTDLSTAIALPASWVRRCDPARGVVVAARPPTVPPSGVSPQITLRVSEPAETDLDTWRERALGELAAGLPGFDLEDDDRVDAGPYPLAYHRFGHGEGGDHVLVEQWAWHVSDPVCLGVTLTCAVARGDYVDYCDLFDAVAASIEPSLLIAPAA